jgi:hypothetical protein
MSGSAGAGWASCRLGVRVWGGGEAVGGFGRGGAPGEQATQGPLAITRKTASVKKTPTCARNPMAGELRLPRRSSEPPNDSDRADGRSDSAMDSRLGCVSRRLGDSRPPPPLAKLLLGTARAAGAAAVVAAGASKPTMTCWACLTGMGADGGGREALAPVDASDRLPRDAAALPEKLKREGCARKGDAAASGAMLPPPSPLMRAIRAALLPRPIGSAALRGADPTGGDAVTTGIMVCLG